LRHPEPEISQIEGEEIANMNRPLTLAENNEEGM
jgi:hypothetical protein